ncbi:MAG: hypothetical protein GY838_00770, partial [bacterium]|nr:hypothetical protein [bacterium]
LSCARVIVLGAGALGNEVISHLAAAGVGHLVIVDFDDVEATNLHRMLLFRADDVGARKAPVAAREALLINPDIRVDAVDGDFRFALGLGAFRRAALVLGCLDSVEARAAAARSCALAGVPFVDAGTNGLLGEVRFYRAEDGPCYECALGHGGRSQVLARWRCTEFAPTPGTVRVLPALGAASGVVGSHQALAAILALSGQFDDWGRAHLYAGPHGEMSTVVLPQDPACPNHAPPLDVTGYPEGHAATTSCAALAAAHPGGREVVLPHTLVVSLECGNGHSEPVGLPIGQVNTPDLDCPRCGEKRRPETLVTLDSRHPLWSEPLASLGVPPGDVVGLTFDDQTRWIELSGDLEDG